MKVITIAAALSVMVAASADAKNEKHWQSVYCAGLAGTKLEYVLPDGARVDCLNAEFAIEVDYVDHWAESVGQALYYASATHRKPGIILLCQSTADEGIYGACNRDLIRLDGALSLVSQPVTVWACALDRDRTLAACKKDIE